MSDYIELTIYTTHEGSELVSDILWNYSEDGVAVNDLVDVIELSKSGKTWDYIDDKILNSDHTVLIKCYFPKKTAQKSITCIREELDGLKNRCPFDLGSLESITRQVDGDLWKKQWKEHFKPIHIGKIVVVPEWIKYDKKIDEKTVIIGSNMAFGTGEHETTSMCVEGLAKYVSCGDVVIDVGCGSGILGIAASKLGAKEVIMTDIDECAVKASIDNCKLNDVQNATVLFKNLLDDNTVKGDIIVANIMAEILCAFATDIGNNLNDNGLIILSGILLTKKQMVKEAYTKNGFYLIEENDKGEWSCLTFKKS